MIMQDLQKAFDTVDHEILCNKLKVMGVRSTKQFQSYLTDSKHKVSANGTDSEFLNVTCGVLQDIGSSAIPLLCK